MLIKINIHSVVDVITNSSTTIYTYCDGSIKPAKELINSFIKLFGNDEIKDKTADDLFYMDIFCDVYTYIERYEDEDEEDIFDGIEDISKYMNNLITKILKNEVEKPQWMIDIEERDDYNGYNPGNNIYIVPKDEKYEDIANNLINFLHSTEEEACYD